MALSLSSFLNPISLLLLATLTHAATVTYDFNITWTTANPDGNFKRSVIGINNQWPIPTIHVNINDRLVVNVVNGLGNVSTSLHFHGMFQNGTTDMDGPVSVNQCAIAPGSSFTYNFTVAQPGTYWYHSHVKGQYPDGLRGPLIVHDPDSPIKDLYDEEIVLTLADWYHQLPSTLLKRFISYANPTGAEPVPDSALMNDTQALKIKIEPGKTYMFRVVNMAAFAAQYLWIEGHTMRIVEVDGVYTEPVEASMLYFTAAQRYSFLVTARNDTGANFPIVSSMDQDLFDTVPASLNPNVTSWLTYDNKSEFPKAKMMSVFEPYDDFSLVPIDKRELLGNANTTITLDMVMDNLGDGANYAFFNGITYVGPKVPTIFTALTSGDKATNPLIYGTNTQSYVLKKDEIVDIVLNNADTGKHPFHLHGHNFQVIARSQEGEGSFANNVTFPKIPMRRDTLLARPKGNFVIRFKAENPGIWLFHCHIDWHMSSGLAVTMIEDPISLQQNLVIPETHYKACRDANIPTVGNAAGNVKDLLDLTGQNTSPAPLPAGFTARGIVALVFSILAALIGIAVISWYGAAPLGAATQAAADREVAAAQMTDSIADADVDSVTSVPKVR